MNQIADEWKSYERDTFAAQSKRSTIDLPPVGLKPPLRVMWYQRWDNAAQKMVNHSFSVVDIDGHQVFQMENSEVNARIAQYICDKVNGEK